jgi:hypothetical protein
MKFNKPFNLDCETISNQAPLATVEMSIGLAQNYTCKMETFERFYVERIILTQISSYSHQEIIGAQVQLKLPNAKGQQSHTDTTIVQPYIIN